MKENLLHVFFVLIVISLFDLQFVIQICRYSTVFKHYKLQQGRGEVVPFLIDWLKGFLVKHDIT